MLVDENKEYALSSYHTKKGLRYKKDSDHNPLVLWLDIMVSLKKPDRIEHFNFKNAECQAKFKELTTSTVNLTTCFENDLTLDKQCNKWFKELNEIFHQSFNKIRSNGKFKKTEVSELMKVLHNLKQKAKLAEGDEKKDIIDNIEKTEDRVANLVAKENSDKIFNNFGMFAGNNGNLNVNGMWAVKKKVFPKNPSSLPVAKKDVDGKVISSHQDLKHLYLETFVHRLRYRAIRDDYEVLITLKETLCNARIVLSKMNKSPPWTAADLHKVLSSLKNNKSRDPWVNY